MEETRVSSGTGSLLRAWVGVDSPRPLGPRTEGGLADSASLPRPQARGNHRPRGFGPGELRFVYRLRHYRMRTRLPRPQAGEPAIPRLRVRRGKLSSSIEDSA